MNIQKLLFEQAFLPLALSDDKRSSIRNHILFFLLLSLLLLQICPGVVIVSSNKVKSVSSGTQGIHELRAVSLECQVLKDWWCSLLHFSFKSHWVIHCKKKYTCTYKMASTSFFLVLCMLLFYFILFFLNNIKLFTFASPVFIAFENHNYWFLSFPAVDCSSTEVHVFTESAH